MPESEGLAHLFHHRTSGWAPVESIVGLSRVICLLFNPGQILHQLQQ